MGKSLVRTKQQISQFNEERPIYGEILDFYDLVLEEQGKTRPQFQIRTIDFDKEPLKSRRRRGVALLEREEFEIDRGAAEKLSHSVCRMGRGFTQKMGEEIQSLFETRRQRHHPLGSASLGEGL